MNENVNNVKSLSERLSSWNYFDYEKLDIQEENKYNKNFTFSSQKDGKINKAGLKESLIHNFDRNYDFYHIHEHVNKHKSLKEHIEEQFSEFLNDSFYFSDLMEIVRELKEIGILKSDISKLAFEATNENIANILSKKFKVK